MVACCRRSRGRLRELSLAPGGGRATSWPAARVSLPLSQKKSAKIIEFMWGVSECLDISKLHLTVWICHFCGRYLLGGKGRGN